MHDDEKARYLMESTLQKVFGMGGASNAFVAEDPEHVPSKRARKIPPDENFQSKPAEFPSTSIADFFNLNGAQNTTRLNFPTELAFTQPPTNSETWARLLAAGTNGLAPLSGLDEAFVEIFADKVAAKVCQSLSPQIQQIRTAIIGLARLVELNQPVEKRVQSPLTPQNSEVPTVITTINPSSTNKRRNPSPSKVEIPPVSSVVVISNNEKNEPSTSITANKPIGVKPNGPTISAHKERKTGEGKSNPKRTVKEVPDVYRIIKLDDLAIHFNMNDKVCLICRETFTESHLHSVKRHMYRKHRVELDTVLQRKTNDPAVNFGDKNSTITTTTLANDLITIMNMKTEYDKDPQDQNELIDVVEVGNVNDQMPKYHSDIPL